MHQSRRVSRSITSSASEKWRGSSANAPSTTPGPLPRSQPSSDTFFGPRGAVHNASPRSASNRPGLLQGSSLSICRYFCRPFSVSSSCALGPAPKTTTPRASEAAAANLRKGFTSVSSLNHPCASFLAGDERGGEAAEYMQDKEKKEARACASTHPPVQMQETECVLFCTMRERRGPAASKPATPVPFRAKGAYLSLGHAVRHRRPRLKRRRSS
jgi:hypothetical protein